MTNLDDLIRYWVDVWLLSPVREETKEIEPSYEVNVYPAQTRGIIYSDLKKYQSPLSFYELQANLKSVLRNAENPTLLLENALAELKDTNEIYDTEHGLFGLQRNLFKFNEYIDLL